MPPIGLNWNGGAGWTLGENCHAENIFCRKCGSLETATVLHTKPENMRVHRCEKCGAITGRDHWRLADGSPVDASAKADNIDPTKSGSQSSGPIASGERFWSEQFFGPQKSPCAARGCFVCSADRAAGKWPDGCPTCEPPPPAQMSLF